MTLNEPMQRDIADCAESDLALLETHFNRPLFWLAVAGVMIAQFALCYEALVCRGVPPLTEAGMNKKWASTFLVWLPAIFGTRVLRLRGLAVLSLWITCLFAMISSNGTLRPSIGHLAGVQGIIETYWMDIAATTFTYFPIVFAILYLPERVFGDAWRALCRLPTANLSFGETWRMAWGDRLQSAPAHEGAIHSIGER